MCVGVDADTRLSRVMQLRREDLAQMWGHHPGLRPWAGYKRTKGESELSASLLLSRCPDCGHHVTSCSTLFPTMVSYTPSNGQGQNHPFLSWFYHIFSRQQQGKKLIHTFSSSHLSPANSIPYLRLFVLLSPYTGPGTQQMLSVC